MNRNIKLYFWTSHTDTHTQLPELAAERGDLSSHGLTAVGDLLQLPLQLPLLGVGARVLLLHLLQLPLQLLQADHRFIQLEEGVGEKRRGEEEEKDRAYCRGQGEVERGEQEERRGRIYEKRD